MKTLKLKNNQLELLLKILDGDLPFSRSRRRKIFTDILMQKLKAREEARLELIKKFGKKDDKGELLLKDNQYSIENIEEFQKEFITLYSEEFIIDVTPSIEESIKIVKDIVEKTDIVVKDNEVEQVEEIIEAFKNA